MILFSNMRFIVMFVTAVCVLFLFKLRWPKKKNCYNTVYMRYGQDMLKMMKRAKKKKEKTFKQTCTSVAATDTVAIAVSIKLKAK